MFCSNCGAQNADNATSCVNCGAQLAQQNDQQPINQQPTYQQPMYQQPMYAAPHNIFLGQYTLVDFDRNNSW